MPKFSSDRIEDGLSKRIYRKGNNNKITTSSLLYGVSLNTNELGVQEAFASLKQFQQIPSGCHFGFSGLHNFDIIAQRKSERAIICDIDPQNAIFLAIVLNILRESANRMIFIFKINQYISQEIKIPHKYVVPVPLEVGSGRLQIRELLSFSSSINFAPQISEDPFYENSHVEDVDINGAPMSGELRKEDGWLYTEERFLHLKKLAEQGKIALITESIYKTEQFEHIGTLLQDNGIQIDTVYVSNIIDINPYNQALKEALVATLAVLTKNNDTLLIDAPACYQRVIQSKLLKQKEPHTWFFGDEAQHYFKKRHALARRQHKVDNLQHLNTIYQEIQCHILQIKADLKGCLGFFTSFRNTQRQQKIQVLQTALTHFKRDKTHFDVAGFQQSLITLVDSHKQDVFASIGLSKTKLLVNALIQLANDRLLDEDQHLHSYA